MFEEIPLDTKTREELVEAFELFDKTATAKLMSEKGTEYLKNRYGKFDKEEYLKGLLDAKEKARLRIKKLQEKEMFSQKFIDEIRYSFEHVFMIITRDLDLYENEEFSEEQKKNFNRFKETYLKLYPHTNFGFDALLKGNTPYGDDYVML